MYKFSDIYKFIIFRLTGLKNDMEFRALETMFDEYIAAKEDEEIKENNNYDDE